MTRRRPHNETGAGAHTSAPSPPSPPSPSSASSAPPASSARLFYALWPDPTTRDALAALQAAVRGRKVAPANLHLTLAFLGSQPRASVPMLDSLLDKLPDQRFALDIDSYGYFSKTRIAWAGPSATPDPLLWVYNALVNALDEAQVGFKSAGGFRPHVTLARDAERVDAEREGVPDVRWPVRTLALVESVLIPGGVQYQLLATRTLG